jgi:hypothetical protein
MESQHAVELAFRSLLSAAVRLGLHYQPGVRVRQIKIVFENGIRMRLDVPRSVAIDDDMPPPGSIQALPKAFAELGQLKAGPGFRTVVAGGVLHFEFTPQQAKVVEQLWRAAQAGTPDVPDAVLLETADSEATRLRDVFRPGGKLDNAWGSLIVQGDRQGTHRLSAIGS